MSDISDYTSLITSEHADKPNFLAFVSAMLQPFVDNLNLIETFTPSYDVDEAVGSQLDVVGQWVGISRQLKLPVSGVYFSFDIPGLGFDEGVWFNSESSLQGVVNMDDGTYRLMIKAKIAANVWDGSLGHANELLAEFLPSVQMQDNLNSTMSFLVTGGTSSQLFLSLVQQGYIQMRPAGVQLV